VRLGSRMFQARPVATGKARSPTVESLVRGTGSAASMWIEVSVWLKQPEAQTQGSLVVSVGAREIDIFHGDLKVLWLTRLH